MTRLQAGSPGLFSGRDKDFFLRHRVQIASGANQPHVQWVPGVKRLGHEAGHSPSSTLRLQTLPIRSHTHIHGQIVN